MLNPLTTAPPRKPSPLTLPAVLLAVFVMPISISGTGIALPAIADDLGTNPTGLQWVINAFNVAFAVFTLVWGVASDRIGHKATFITGVALLLAASLLSALSPNLWVLDISRVIAGIAGAAVFTGAASILSNVFVGAARSRAFAIFGTTIGLGVALGPTIAGGLVEWLGWQGVYVAFAVIAVLALLGSALIPRATEERETGHKLIDLSLLRNKRFMTFALVPIAAGVGFVTLTSYLPVALSAVSGMPAGQAGLFMLWMTAPVLVTPLLGAKLAGSVKAFSSMTMVYVSLLALFLGDVGILLLNPNHSVALLIAPMILLGIGFGLPLGLIDAEALAAVPSRSSGTAAGVINFLRLGTEAIAVGAYAAVLTGLMLASLGSASLANDAAAGRPGHAVAYAGALHIVALALAAIVLVLTVLIAGLHRASLRESGMTQEEEDAQAAEKVAAARELKIDPLA